jgi:hypothetical protein
LSGSLSPLHRSLSATAACGTVKRFSAGTMSSQCITV